MKKILLCLISSTLLLSAAGAAKASAESEQDSICQALVTLANRDFADQWDDASDALAEDGYARRIYDNSTRFFASLKPEHYLLLKAAQRKQLSPAKLVEAFRDVVYPMNAQLSREAADRAKKGPAIKIAKNRKARPIAPYLVDLTAAGDTVWYSACGPIFDGPELTCYKLDELLRSRGRRSA